MRILVTGASGFIGRQTTQALKEDGADVYALSRRSKAPAIESTWLTGDLLDFATTDAVVSEVRPSTVIHCAWNLTPGQFWNNRENLDWVGASLHLAQASVKAGCRRFIGIGTCYEYDWPSDADCSEYSTPLASHTLYDVCKDATRRVLASYLGGENVEFVWARVFFLYGPSEAPERLVSSLARSLLEGKPARTSSGVAVRDYMDVRDAGAALAAVALSAITGPVNIGTGQPIKIADIARRLGKLAGRPECVSIGSLPDRPNEPPRIVADVNRLKKEVQFQPRHSLESGLRDALRYWKERNGR
jgi:nucleoside-diphosphate-sugar epimerase